MKTSILITSEAKQIMLVPETEAEKIALGMISPDEEIHTIIKQGSFTDISGVFGADVYKCQGGYYRAEEKAEAVMFVITPKKHDT